MPQAPILAAVARASARTVASGRKLAVRMDGASRKVAVRMDVSRRTVVVRALQLGVVGALAVAAFGYVHSTKTVTVRIDGVARQVHTFSGDVRGVLQRAHVDVGAHDAVSPALGASVHDHGVVDVRRGRLLTLTVGPDTRDVWVTAPTVQDALEELHLDEPGAWVSAPRSAAVATSGAALAVRLPQDVSIAVDGQRRVVTTTDTQVRDVLADAGVQLGGTDRVSVPLTAYPTDGMVLAVTRISSTRQVATQVVARTTTRVADDTLYRGSTRTVSAGQDGVIESVYVVTYTNGRPTQRTLASQRTTAVMEPTVVAYGIKAPPAPPPAAVPVSASGSGLNWAALAACESGGNPRSVSAGGTYRGLYQFTMGAWHGVGGAGDPIDASAAEQTYRAQLLLARSGRGAWPVCGRYL